MRAEIYDRLICVSISERNLLTAIYKLRHQRGAKALISGNVHCNGQAVDGLALVLAVEPDSAHYGDREPGEFDGATEAWLEDHLDLLDSGQPVEALIVLKVGPVARMISGSKSGFARTFPDEAAIFNGNVFAQAEGGPVVKVWHGDLNLTRDESALVDVAGASGETLWVLFEKDGRFRGRDENPHLGRAQLRAHPDGTVVFDEENLVRADDGTLRLRHVYEREHRPLSEGDGASERGSED